jgi:MSHA biogenesis protein MshJ
MKAYVQRWKTLEQRYMALSRRERVMVAAALVLGPLLIGNALLVDPQWNRAKLLETGLARQEASLTELQAQVTMLGQQLQADPDAGRKNELSSLQQRIDELDKEIHTLGSTLVKPEEMNALLSQLLSRQAGLRLVSLKTQAPASVLGVVASDGASKPAERLFDLYRHGVEIKVEGNYSDLTAYVARVEAEKSRLLVDRLNYRVVDYPRAELTLTVYTLSSEKAWLSL